MKRITIIIFLILITSAKLKCQNNKDSIIYILPDNIELMIFEYTEKIDTLKYNFEFFLSRIGDEEFKINISLFKRYNDNFWYNNTNRYILINNKRYPLILDYDSLFSTSKPVNLGKMGKREGYILRSTFIYDGFSISFNKEGKVIK